MKRWSSRQILALVVGAFLALGVSLSVVQAVEDALQMATMTDDADTSGPGKCDGCGDGDNGKGMATCAPVVNCSGMAAVLPVERGLVAPHAADVFIPVSSVARSLIAPPDPYPPRSRDLS